MIRPARPRLEVGRTVVVQTGQEVGRTVVVQTGLEVGSTVVVHSNRNMAGQERASIISEIQDKERTRAVIRETIYVTGEESSNYFIRRILTITSQQYIVGGRVNTAFIKLLIEDSNDNRALRYLNMWLDK